jgi:hypothetical protein
VKEFVAAQTRNLDVAATLCRPKDKAFGFRNSGNPVCARNNAADRARSANG